MNWLMQFEIIGEVALAMLLGACFPVFKFAGASVWHATLYKMRSV